ncbi:hypothetical protein D3C75_876820 [compost metagenome]
MVFPDDLFDAPAAPGSAFHELQTKDLPVPLFLSVINQQRPLSTDLLPALMCYPYMATELGKMYRVMSWSVMRKFIKLGGVSDILANAILADPSLRSLLTTPEHIVAYHIQTKDRLLGIDLRLPAQNPVAAARLCVALGVRVPNWEGLIQANPAARSVYYGAGRTAGEGR